MTLRLKMAHETIVVPEVELANTNLTGKSLPRSEFKDSVIAFVLLEKHFK